MRISEEMTHESYIVARSVYNGVISRRNGVADLVERVGMNAASAGAMVNNLRCMLNGDEYHRTMNRYTTRYYLERIREDFGESAFVGALKSVERHLDYYDSLEKGKHPGLRQLLAELATTVVPQNLYPDEIEPTTGLTEGAGRKVFVNSYERSRDAREACLRKHGVRCAICEFDFGQAYGEIGEGFIHVHHLVELSTIGKEYVVDPENDLRPVCPNCHAMLHRRKPCLTVEELRSLLKRAQS